MPITEKAKSVIERPLDKNRIKQRSGGAGGMTFDYIGAEYAIQLLNEAFDYSWDSRVFHHENTGDLVIVGVELKVWDDAGNSVTKQQFGSCNINRGVDVGSAFKGAASDGLKKCASQLGLALELYLDEPASAGFNAPTRQPAAAPTKPAPSRPTPAPHARRPPPSAPPAPPARRPPMPDPGPRTNPLPSGQAPAPTQPHKPPAVPRRVNPFEKDGATTASVPRTPAPAAPVKRADPFGGGAAERGINTTQMSALTSLAGKKGISPPNLIALAEIADPQGAPKQEFENLTHGEAIQVIKAAQLK